MSQPSPAAKSSEPTISARHYQVLCGLALATMFLVQVQQSNVAMPMTLLANLLVVFVGTLGILYRLRLSPLLVLLTLALPHIVEQYQSNQLFNPDFRSLRFDLADVMLCIAMLAYMIGHYRLLGLWFGLLPADARQSADDQARAASSLSAAELVALIVPIPAYALIAQLASFAVKQPWTFIELTPRWKQFLVVAWAILFGMFLAAHFFRYWRRLQMGRFTAQLLLQDELWQQTRGEQRRIQRWIVWKRLKK
jgi:hypothetical protein